MLRYFLSLIYSLMDSILVTDILTPSMAMETLFSARDEKDYIHSTEIFQHERKLCHIKPFPQKA